MSAAKHRWLLEQIPAWEGEGLLTADAARILRERHAAGASGPGLGQVMLGVLGALLVGSGLIAVIGHNWDSFSRPVRLLFAFLPLLLSQVFTWRVLAHPAPAAWVRETAALLQALTTGACIALVSQIYNMGGEWPDFLFWWFLLSLPLAWVLRSDSVSVFYLVSTAVWAMRGVENGMPWHDSALLYPLLLLALLPRWWRARAPSGTLRWIIAVCAALGLGAAAAYAVGHGYYSRSHFGTLVHLWSLTAAVFVLFPLNARGIAESAARKPQMVLGCLWLLGFGIAGTYQSEAADLMKDYPNVMTLAWGRGLLAALGLLTALALWQRRWAALALASVVMLPLLARFLPNLSEASQGPLLGWLFTAHLTLVGLVLILLDFAGRPAAPRLGAALFCALILARMADSHFSLLAKGLVFIAVGVAFLAFNFFISRHRAARREVSA